MYIKRIDQKVIIVLAFLLLVCIFISTTDDDFITTDDDTATIDDSVVTTDKVTTPISDSINHVVTFADKNLERIIRAEINKSQGNIMVADLIIITKLNAISANIVKLDGLEYLTNLTNLNLRGNNITHITPLSNLTKINKLNLRDNNISDISALINFNRLKSLNLRDNMIVDISIISSLNRLEQLNLRGNRIGNIANLKGLDLLKDLNLRNNRITNFITLKNLTNLTDRLYLSGNYTDDFSELKSIYNKIKEKDFFVEKYLGIPQIHINTNDRPIVSKTTRIEAFMTIKNSGSSNYPELGLYEGRIGIRGRGNSSWGGEKKPYSIKLLDHENNAIDSIILDLPEEDNWILVPNHYDKSLMRNYIALDLAQKLGMPYVPRTRYVEVYLNNQYEGNYLLVEKIKRDKNRLGIKKLTNQDRDQMEPRITGGYILRIDRIEGRAHFKTSITGQDILFHYPKGNNITNAQKKYITDYVNELESALYGSNFKDPLNGYRKYIDVDSFVDWYIINELAKDVDTWRLSTYLYKDRGEKLAIGPAWDFDISFGNANYMDGWKTEGTNVMFNEHYNWLNRLMKDEYFIRKVQDRWKEIKPLIDGMIDTIDETAIFLQESADRNFDRWDILGRYIWPNVAPFPTTYGGEIERLKEWIIARTKWMDSELLN